MGYYYFCNCIVKASFSLMCFLIYLCLKSLKNGDSSPLHQPNVVTVDLPIITQPLVKTEAKQPIKTETTLRPACSVKQERVPIQPCNVRQIKPLPPTTVTVQTISLPTSSAQTQPKIITSPHSKYLRLLKFLCLFTSSHCFQI